MQAQAADFWGKVELNARQRRHQVLASLLKTFKSPPTILDIGGTMDYWKTLGVSHKLASCIVLLNMFEQPVNDVFESVTGDARDLSRYRDQQFDLVFSNSVIGHVGAFGDQLRMAREMQRVGKSFFLQTPNHGFPLDWRTRIPYFHWLPVPAQAWCFERFGVGSYAKAADRAQAVEWAMRIRNIRRGELARLFPGATVVDERVCGFTKSFMVHNITPGH